MAKKKLSMGREELTELYSKHTTTELSVMFGVHHRTIQNWMRKFGIYLSDAQVSERQRDVGRLRAKGRKTKSRGYVLVMAKCHPRAGRDGYVQEHRLVVESAIGRYLYAEEQVHHLDGNKHGNSLENLMLLPSGSSHTSFHKWLEKVGSFVLGFTKAPPERFVCEGKMWLRGRWVDSVGVDDFRAQG